MAFNTNMAPYPTTVEVARTYAVEGHDKVGVVFRERDRMGNAELYVCYFTTEDLWRMAMNRARTALSPAPPPMEAS